MWKVLLVVAALSAAEAFSGGSVFKNLFSGGNKPGGGGDCATCTIAVGLLEQIALINEKEVDKVIDEVCSFLPSGPFKSACDFVVFTYGDRVVELLMKKESADTVCHHLGACTEPTCYLFDPPNKSLPPMPLKNIVKKTPWDFLKELINKIGNEHQPVEDFDNDRFSLQETLRGSAWRGKDCDDFDRSIYPGRSATKHSAHVDHDCNGIVGTDPESGSSYEDVLCKNTDSRGIILIGDSAGAHFEIPPEYLSAKDINSTTFKAHPNILHRVMNEFDLPEKSWGTGYAASTPSAPVDSLYLRMLKRNRCNHRDFQNTGVNGARSGAVAHGKNALMRDFARNNQTDKPVSLIFELVGNDVCNGHPDYWNTMTKVEDFRANVLEALEYLDTQLPPSSHVMFVGLADGRVLWDSLYDRMHPINTTYSNMYHFLNCLEISPCLVWMNRNETIRNAGTARAMELNKVYGEIIANHTFKNFDMIYYDFPFEEISKIWTAQGGEVWQLIEAVDGFHPNQFANALIAQVLEEHLSKDMPEFLGKVNPNNDRIVSLFGDQGGY